MALSNCVPRRWYHPREFLVSAVLLGLAAGVFWHLFIRGEVESDPTVAAEAGDRNLELELSRICSDDPLLASRMANQWAYNAIRVGDEEGVLGLQTLDIFGDDALYLFEKNRSAFRDLGAIVDLDGSLHAASTGPWRKAVVEWAMAGRLSAYREFVEKLGPSEREEIRKTPASLPLLGADAPTAKRMLAKYGSRAWRLFMLIDFKDEGEEGLERVAAALQEHGEEMLNLNERYGLAIALLLVPPPNDSEGRLPEFFLYAAEKLGVDEATTLFLTNHEDLTSLLLKENRSSEDLIEVIDTLAGQQAELREVVSESGHAVRLLLEKRNREQIGFRALRRCGPFAAELVFGSEGYGADQADRAAVLLLMSHNGPECLDTLEKLRGWDHWHKLLRRGDLRIFDADPLLCRVAREIARSPFKQDKFEALLKMPAAQIEARQFPPTTGEKALEWVPGYLAMKAVADSSRGYHLENSEIFWAVFDGVTTISILAKLPGQALKTVGKQAGKEVVAGLEKQGAEEAFTWTQRKALREAAKVAETNLPTRSLVARVPGGVLALVRTVPGEALKFDVTQIMRTASAVAKKVGVRTWGKLDRRIIQRNDRRVLIDLTNPEFLESLGETAKLELLWSGAGAVVGELAPCILERVVPGLRGD